MVTSVEWNMSTLPNMWKGVNESVRYCLLDFWLQHADRRVAHWWMVRHGLVPSLGAVALYLSLVLVLLPRLVRHRRLNKSATLRSALFIYNVCMSLANVGFAGWALRQWDYGRAWFDLKAPSEHDTSASQLEAIRFEHVYLLSKFVDLCDTVFVVLHGKPVTLLHVYHHGVSPIISHISFVIHPSSTPAGIFAFFNSVVHSLTYSYLALATLGPSVRKHIWWKKHITQAEIFQFVIFSLFTALYGVYSQGYSMAYIWIAISQNPIFLYLFIDFYFKTYRSKRKSNID